MKILLLIFFILILVGCNSSADFENQKDPQALEKANLKAVRENTLKFLPNTKSVKFRNQFRDCGELSYMEDNNQYSPFKRFVMVEKNIILIEGWTGQEQFELAWKVSC
ncbi:hypothetical protein ACS72_06355 [Acinetobacter sp. VT 511]|uniref:hypothetical protein n=1 Tax=Acinetobacter sp. VT 511 TaxID=1675902 RepID=UPI000661FEEB|nr:hypothetical protein [Acinetobacter sp. VT 511]KMU99932.1 hypothetical protein ACS72_06355 [Acinetobacter sp. VT 511]